MVRYQIEIPTFYLIPCFVLFIICFYFFIKILIEYEQEKDNLNKEYELQEQNDFVYFKIDVNTQHDAYFYEVRKKV